MRHRLVAAVAILLPLAIQAQTSQSAPAKATVSGTIFDTSNNQPLKKVTIKLEAAESSDQETPSLTAISGADGAFSITDIDPGRYQLSVERSGFLLARKARRLRVLSLQAGQNIRGLQLPMLPAGILTGRILDKDGDPLPNVSVQLMPRGRFTFAGGGYVSPTQTNDIGEYRIFQVPPGSYYVAAYVGHDYSAPLENKPKSGPSVGYVPVYYPGTNDFARAVALEIESGAEIRADLVMVPGPVFDVRGKVLTAPGERADYTAVMLHPDGNLGISSGRSIAVKQDGTFEATGIPPGSYYALAITTDVRSRKSRMAQVKFEVAEADVEGLFLNLSAAATVRGRILIEGKPAFDVSQLGLSLQWADESPYVPRYGDSETGSTFGYAKINRDGTFVVKNLMPGAYFPQVFSNSDDSRAIDYYVKAVRYGNRDISNEELVIDEAGSTQPLEVLIGTRGQTVSGLVQDSDGKPTAALVVALPDAKRRKRIRFYDRSWTDQQGRFTLRGLQPGDYTLIALDEVEEDVALDHEFLAQFESQGLAFRARERGRDTVTLKLVPIDDQ